MSLFGKLVRTVVTTERLDSFVSLVAGKRITYKRLTKGSTWFDDSSLQVAEIV